jgi:hypothetical protein
MRAINEVTFVVNPNSFDPSRIKVYVKHTFGFAAPV